MHGETLKRDYEYSEFFCLASRSMGCHQSALILLKKWGTDKPLYRAFHFKKLIFDLLTQFICQKPGTF